MSDKKSKKSSEYEVEETEVLRSQALAQFREWIEKDPNILKCQTYDAFLLRFLRIKKFRITDAFKLFVSYLTVRKMKPYLFENLRVECPKFKYFLDNHVSYVLPKPDKYGRLVFIAEFAKCDPKKFEPIDIIRLGNLTFEYLCHNERSQLNGVVYVVDFTGLSMSIAAMATPTIIRELRACWLNNYPIRNKMNLYINLPPVLNGLLLLFTSLLSEKMRSRFKIIQSHKEIVEEIGVEILPKEFGGVVPAADIAELHKQRLIEVQDEIEALNNSFDIIPSKSSTDFGNSNDAKLDLDIVGSFRKIEVD